jgi:hypothetical protein
MRLIVCHIGLALHLFGIPATGEEGQTSARGMYAVPEEVQTVEGFDPASSRALFVGVSQFDDQRFAEVPFAVDDAVDLAHLFSVELQLVDPAHVVLCISGEPRKPDARERLRNLTGAGATRRPADQSEVYRQLSELGRSSESAGLFIVGVATHGFSELGVSYLVTSDSLRPRIQRTGIVVEEVFDDVARANAPRRLVLLDACRERLSGETRAGGADPESVASQALVDAIGDARGQVVLSASKLGGYSYDDHRRRNGVFTAAVLDGLRGGAPANERNFVTARTLAGFVNNEVTNWVGENRPRQALATAGIEIRFEGAADRMPLAVSPTASLSAYQERREAALETLRENIGRHITGSMYDDISRVLPTGEHHPVYLELLDEIEALDGTERSQRILADYFEQRRPDFPGEDTATPTEPEAPTTRDGETRCGKTWSEGDREVRRVLGTSFENLHVVRPNRIDPFEPWNRGRAMGAETAEGLTRWQPTRVAHSGEFGLSPTPNGNPGIDGHGEINSVLLPNRFDVSGAAEILLYFYINTTSNPRVRAVHNCDSSLSIYFRYDDRPWAHKMAICGSHKTESRGWRPASYSFNTSLVSTVQFGLVYGLQNSPDPDPEAFFVIDDLEVCVVEQ